MRLFSLLIILVSFLVVGFRTSDAIFMEKVEMPSMKKIKKKLGVLDVGSIYSKNKRPSEKEVALGKMLFFDTRLSKENNIACASCHSPESGFGDGVQFSKGTHGNVLDRHTPSLYNLAWKPSMFWDGRVSSLEKQADAVITNPDEMDMSFDSLIERLSEVEEYKLAFETIFSEEKINKKNIIRAIVSFEKTLITSNSPYDKYMKGDTNALSASALNGLALFMGKANCIACHNGPNFTNDDFHNIGLITDDLGRQALDRISMKREFEMTPYPFFASFKAFKTQSLRNVELSAPYYHDGSKVTLEEVVEFYNKGGENTDRTGVAKEIRTLNLTDNEKKDLVSFLKSLTDKIEMEQPALP